MVVVGVLARIVKALRFPGADYVPGATVLFLGFMIAVFSGDPEWFRRFGGLLIALALLMAAATFRFQQQYEIFREYMEDYRTKIHDLDIEDLTETRDGKSYYRLKFPSFAFFAFVRASELDLMPDMEGIFFIEDDHTVISILQHEFGKFHKMVLDVVKRELDDLFRLELIHAAVGTFVAAFGDLPLFWL